MLASIITLNLCTVLLGVLFFCRNIWFSAERFPHVPWESILTLVRIAPLLFCSSIIGVLVPLTYLSAHHVINRPLLLEVPILLSPTSRRKSPTMSPPPLVSKIPKYRCTRFDIFYLKKTHYSHAVPSRGGMTSHLEAWVNPRPWQVDLQAPG